MSRYGWFVCDQCRVQLWLGKAVFDANERVDHFHRGPAESPRNWADPQFARVLSKMLADHADHPLRVTVEGDPRFNETAGYAEIGGDTANDVSFEDYLKDWRG